MKITEDLHVESEQQQHTALTVPAFGYDLLRNVLIPEILGKDTSEIMYWAGKQLARKQPLQSIEDIVTFFQEAGWGYLELIKQDKKGIDFELSSAFITDKIKNKQELDFQLEAGFLAEQMQLMKDVVSECYEDRVKRGKKILFQVRWV